MITSQEKNLKIEQELDVHGYKIFRVSGLNVPYLDKVYALVLKGLKIASPRDVGLGQVLLFDENGRAGFNQSIFTEDAFTTLDVLCIPDVKTESRIKSKTIKNSMCHLIDTPMLFELSYSKDLYFKTPGRNKTSLSKVSLSVPTAEELLKSDRIYKPNGDDNCPKLDNNLRIRVRGSAKNELVKFIFSEEIAVRRQEVLLARGVYEICFQFDYVNQLNQSNTPYLTKVLGCGLEGSFGFGCDNGRTSYFIGNVKTRGINLPIRAVPVHQNYDCESNQLS